MAQRFRTDQMGTLSHGSGIITLGPSRLTIGGQQYATSTLQLTVSGLAIRSFYRIYVVVTSGVASLVVSLNKNSLGPAGYNGWKLVGHFYSGESATVNAIGPASNEAFTNMPALRLYMTANAGQSILNNNSTGLLLDNTIDDNYGIANLGSDSAIIPRDGAYNFEAAFGVNSGGTTNRLTTEVRDDGSTILQDQLPSTVQGNSTLPVLGNRFSAKNSVITVNVTQETGATRTILGSITSYLAISAPPLIVRDEDL